MKKVRTLIVLLDLLIFGLLGLSRLPGIKELTIDRLSGRHDVLLHTLYFDQELSTDLCEVSETDLNSYLLPEEKVSKLSLIMAGDSLIHNSVYMWNETPDGGYDFNHIFDNTRDIIQSYDLAYYNQETMLGDSELGLSGYPQFNSPYEVGDAFVAAGFNLVSTATNHSLDRVGTYGDQAILNSRAYWDKQEAENGVIMAGTYASYEDREKVRIGEKNGITYALLSYTCGTNGLAVPHGEDYLLNIFDEDQVRADVEKYRPLVDLLIVAMHWGVEYVYEPNAQQLHIAKFLADLDVDLVIGNHSHVLQPIQMIDDTLVVYCLGNFVSHQPETYMLISCLLGVEITKTEKNGVSDITFDNLDATMIFTDKDHKFDVYPFSKIPEGLLDNKEEWFKQFKDVLTNYWDAINVHE